MKYGQRNEHKPNDKTIFRNVAALPSEDGRILLVDDLHNERPRDVDRHQTYRSPGRGRNSDHAEALDHLHELYEARIKDYKVNPPPADWNGAYQLLTK